MNVVTRMILMLNIILIPSCSPPTEDQKFEALARNHIEAVLAMNPQWATSLGDHRYDHLLNDYSKEGVEKDRRFVSAYLDSLTRIDYALLSTANNVDYRIMRTNLEYWLYQLDSLRDYEWNPLNYNIGGAMYSLLARDFAPLRERLMNVRERMKGIPVVLAAARTNLRNPPRVHTETAILQNPGTIALVRDQLNEFLEQAPELKDAFAPVQAEAVNALEHYGAWLKDTLLPRSTGEFRLGDSKFRRKLYFALESDLSKEEILRRAEADLKQTQETMYETALPLYRKFHPNVRDERRLRDRKSVIKAVLDRLAEDRPTNETIVDLARTYTESITEFTRNNNIVTVPEEPIRIIVMPEFQRGVAVAYCDAPGPLEKSGETFYAISPTPADWSAQRVESFYREYNNYMLQNLTIHEATPGHYLQLAHSNKFRAPTLIRAIFYSGTFVEGWATYAEQLMVEMGYGGPEVKMQQLKMRLRLIINALIDQKIHTAGMTEKEAMNLMMNEGFQEEGEAAGKWRRACLTSTQLSTYYVGNTEVNAIRRLYEAKAGAKRDMKLMHDTMISFGSPAPRYVKELMGL